MGCQSIAGLPLSINFAGTHLYTWVERGTVRVKCLAQEHNTMSPAKARTRTARSGDERTNHEATAPPPNKWEGRWLLLWLFFCLGLTSLDVRWNLVFFHHRIPIFLKLRLSARRFQMPLGGLSFTYATDPLLQNNTKDRLPPLTRLRYF